MIRAVSAIMYLTLRQAWASRSILGLGMAALVPAVIFPLIIKGDNTPTGAYRMLMTYAPMGLFALLLSGSIWLGAFALATERLHLQFAMLKTKPVRGVCIWLGKWLGVCMVLLLVLTLSGSIFAAMLHLRRESLVPASHAFWLSYAPDEQAIWQQARRIQSSAPPLSHQITHPAPHPPLQQIVNRLRQQQYRVAPGSTVSWQIPLPTSAPNARPWRLHYRWRLDPMRRSPVSGTWLLLDPTTMTTLATRHVNGLLDGNHILEWGTMTLPLAMSRISLRFQSAAENAPDIFFDTRSPISLQHEAAPRWHNLMRAAGIMLVYCIAVAAIALSLSAYFSFPVAVFATHGLLVALLIAAVAGQPDVFSGHDHVHDHGAADGWILDQSTHLLDVLHSHTLQLGKALPFQELSEHLQITLRDYTAILLLLGLVLPLLCAGLAHARIQRGEAPQ